MAFSSTPSKRHFDRDLTDYNGKGKLRKSSGFFSKNKSSKASTGASAFRVLCPASRTGSIIGKGGSVISQIRQETNAKVKIEETVPGCVERIISIKGSGKDTVERNLLGKDDGNETKDPDDGNLNKGNKEEDEKKQGEDDDDNKDYVLVEDTPTVNKPLSAQKALLLVFEKMIEGDALIDTEADEDNQTSRYVLRLLVYSNQVGCILGKGGSAIRQMSSESGALIRILPRDKLPVCASHSDELCEITGGLDEARIALQLVSKKLLESLPRDSDAFPVTCSGTLSRSNQSHLKPVAFPLPSFPYSGVRDDVDYYSTAPLLTPIFPDTGAPPQNILTIRILCHSDKVGCVIGKAGAIIKTLQLDTGCEIKVLEGVDGTEDRIIVISGPAHPHDRISAAQEALLRIQSQIFKFTPENYEKTVIARILVSSSQIGCLLGMGGAIIAEMRKETGAYIRILGKEQVPKCASENEEVVQITGEVGTVQEALLQITSRLRNHLFRDMFPSMNLSEQVPPFPLYMGRREHSPPGMYSNLNQPFPNFEADGLRHRGFPAPADQSPFMHNPGRPLLPHLSERNPWASQGLSEGGGPLSVPDYPGVHRKTGFGGGRQPAVITNTTVNVIVPRSLVPEIYGEDGESLNQIRQISDAKIIIGEPKPGATESVITISGTPEQTHAAQSLIQAFVMCESETA